MTLDFMSANTIGRAPHQQYSPNLADCDIYLFGYINESLAGKAFADQEESEEIASAVMKGQLKSCSRDKWRPVPELMDDGETETARNGHARQVGISGQVKAESKNRLH
jgi:hypothetical protein